MAGEVKHQWNGSILTVISDAGASSADLKGPRGDTGPRGPQGPGGVVYNDDGELIVDLSPYATREELEYAIENNQPDLDIFATKPYVIETVYGALPNMNAYATKTDLDEKCKPFVSKSYVDLAIKDNQPDLTPYATKSYVNNEIENIDLPAYATKNYVSTEIAKAQLSGGGDGSGVDLSGFATKDDLTTVETKVDGKTILRDAHGNIYTSLGGYKQDGAVNYINNNMHYIPQGNWGGQWSGGGIAGNIGVPFIINTPYQIKLTFKDGYSISFEMVYSSIGTTGQMMTSGEYWDFTLNMGATNTHLSEFVTYSNGDFKVATPNYVDTSILLDDYILTGVSVYVPGFIPIDGQFIPVDGNTIYLNEQGKLSCSVDVGGGSGSGDISLTNYYTKAEVDALILGLSGSGGGSAPVDIPSGEEVDY